MNAAPTVFSALDTDGRRGKCSSARCLVATHSASYKADPSGPTGLYERFYAFPMKVAASNRNNTVTVVVDVCTKLSRCCFACDKSLVGVVFCSGSCWKIGTAFTIVSPLDELCSISECKLY